MPLCQATANWLGRTPRAGGAETSDRGPPNMPIPNPLLERELDVDDFTMMIVPQPQQKPT